MNRKLMRMIFEEKELECGYFYRGVMVVRVVCVFNKSY